MRFIIEFYDDVANLTGKHSACKKSYIRLFFVCKLFRWWSFEVRFLYVRLNEWLMNNFFGQIFLNKIIIEINEILDILS